jgi:hypothetical protein
MNFKSNFIQIEKYHTSVWFLQEPANTSHRKYPKNIMNLQFPAITQGG